MLIASLFFAAAAAAAGGSLRGLSPTTYSVDEKCQQHPHLIKSLPDTEFSTLPFCMYSGNINLPSADGAAQSSEKSIFYWLVESERANSTDKSLENNDPLVLWFNGGPSCSSLIGLFHELGPFYPTDHSTLARSKFGWNRNANVLFVDSPAGVGFSESASGSIGDHQTAQEALEFLQGFITSHPEYSNRPVWLTGESYAGHYVPHLATAIMLANLQLSDHRNLRRANVAQKINLQGFLVGNPATDDSWEYDGGSKFTALFNANFLSTSTYLHVQEACKGMNPFGDKPTDMNVECRQAMGAASIEGGSSLYNGYSIYADTCQAGGRRLTAARALQNHRGLGEGEEAAQPLNLNKHGTGLTDPCIKDFTEAYLRRPDVVSAIHAPTNKLWTECSGTQRYEYTKSVLDKYNMIIDGYREGTVPKLRMLVYSGDIDAVVPTVGTRAWIDSLKLKETSAWKPWEDDSHQLGGFTQQYEDGLLTFATVREAGHEVPQYQPERALAMFESFITTNNMPSK